MSTDWCGSNFVNGHPLTQILNAARMNYIDIKGEDDTDAKRRRVKLGYYPLPIEEAQNLGSMLVHQHRMPPLILAPATVGTA